jgi:hypothetical protein
MMRGFLAASMAALALVTAGPARADEPPPPPWPTGCQSPIAIGAHPAIRRWCGEPLFGFGPSGQGAGQSPGEPEQTPQP